MRHFISALLTAALFISQNFYLCSESQTRLYLSPSSSFENPGAVEATLRKIEKNLHPLLGLPAVKLLQRWREAAGDPSALGERFWSDYRKLLLEYERISRAPSGWVYNLYPELRRTAGEGTVLSLTADLMLEHPELIGLGTGGLGVLKRDDTFAFGEAFGPGNYFLCAPFYSRKSRQVIDGEQSWIFDEVNKAKVPLIPLPDLIRVRYGEGEGENAPPTQRYVYMKVWRAEMGKGTLLLLDTDIPENEGWDRFTDRQRAQAHYRKLEGAGFGFKFDQKHDRKIMERIYPRDREGTDTQRQRFKQFVLLSLGSFEAFKLVNRERGIEIPSFLHLNDPHTAPAAAKVLVDPKYQNVLTVYTNHTLVEGAGTQMFHPAGQESHHNPWNHPYFFLPYNHDQRVTQAFEAYGNVEFAKAAEILVGSQIRYGRVNAVNTDEHAVKLGQQKPWLYRPGDNLVGVDNGVDINWAPPEFRFAWEGLSPEEIAARAAPNAARLSDQTIRAVKRQGKENLNPFMEENLRRLVSFLEKDGTDADGEKKERAVRFLKERMGRRIDPDKMLVVFAKRINGYKRPTLILGVVDEIERQLQGRNTSEEIQIVFAGKSNDSDEYGKEIVRDILKLEKVFAERGGRVKIFYLPDYHIEMSQKLLAASDFWLNTPERHREASGTSLLKAAMNGSILISTQSGAACHEAFFEHGVNALLVDVDGRRRDGAGKKVRENYEKHYRDLSVEAIEKEQLAALVAEAHALYYRPEEQARFAQMRRAAIAKIYEMSSLRQALDQIQKTFMPLLFRRDLKKEVVRYGVAQYTGKGNRFEVEVNIGAADPRDLLVQLRYWDNSLEERFNWWNDQEDPDNPDSYHIFSFGKYEEIPGKPGHYIFYGKPPFQPGPKPAQYVVKVDYKSKGSVFNSEFDRDPWVVSLRKTLRETLWVGTPRGGYKRFDEWMIPNHGAFWDLVPDSGAFRLPGAAALESSV